MSRPQSATLSTTKKSRARTGTAKEGEALDPLAESDGTAALEEPITYILDTSVLISDPRAMFRFKEHEVVLTAS